MLLDYCFVKTLTPFGFVKNRRVWTGKDRICYGPGYGEGLTVGGMVGARQVTLKFAWLEAKLVGAEKERAVQ